MPPIWPGPSPHFTGSQEPEGQNPQVHTAHRQNFSELAEWRGLGTALFTLAGNNDSQTLMNNLKQMQGRVNIFSPLSNDKAPRLSRREEGAGPSAPFVHCGPNTGLPQAGQETTVSESLWVACGHYQLL